MNVLRDINETISRGNVGVGLAHVAGEATAYRRLRHLEVRRRNRETRRRRDLRQSLSSTAHLDPIRKTAVPAGTITGWGGPIAPPHHWRRASPAPPPAHHHRQDDRLPHRAAERHRRERGERHARVLDWRGPTDAAIGDGARCVTLPPPRSAASVSSPGTRAISSDRRRDADPRRPGWRRDGIGRHRLHRPRVGGRGWYIAAVRHLWRTDALRVPGHGPTPSAKSFTALVALITTGLIAPTSSCGRRWRSPWRG